MTTHVFNTKEDENLHSVSFLEAIKLGFKNYVNFRGRAGRKEFWYWFLFIGIVIFALRIARSVLMDLGWVSSPLIIFDWFLITYDLIFWYMTVIPTVAIITRRLHDIGKSGWYQAAWYLLIIAGRAVLGVSLALGGIINQMYEVLVFGIFGGLLWIITPLDPIMVVFNFLGYTVYRGGMFEGACHLEYTCRELTFIYLLLGLVPVLVSIWLILWTLRKSDVGANKYGLDPRQALSSTDDPTTTACR
tara:strand:- start:60 stop:797 length:738 start_codon:yes stop_codon:yes gene_type:complete